MIQKVAVAKLEQAGVTIIELLIAVGIASILSTVLLSVSLSYYADSMRHNQSAQLVIEAHYAMRAVIEDIRLATAVANTNNLADANQPAGGWQTDDTHGVFVLDSPAIDSAHNIIYDSSTGYPYENEFIYYISNRSLRKRTLKNTAAAGNAAITSCPTATSTCPDDKTYSSSIDNFSLTFYDQNNAVTTTASEARSVKLTLTASRRTFGRTITFNNTLQTTLRNY